MAAPVGNNRGNVHPITHTGFARAYLIEGENGLMAVDVGSIGCAKDVAEYVTGILNRPLDDIRYITATHFHVDHIGGIGHLLALCPFRTRVLFHDMVKAYLSGERKISLIRSWCVGLTPALLVSARSLRRVSHLIVESLTGIPLPGLRTITRLPFDTGRIGFFGDEEQSVSPLDRFGFGGWKAILTPGHTEDSVCFYHEATGELLSGDLIVNVSKDGRGRLNPFCWRRDLIKESYEHLLRTIRPSVIYPGHGEVILGPDPLSRVTTFDRSRDT